MWKEMCRLGLDGMATVSDSGAANEDSEANKTGEVSKDRRKTLMGEETDLSGDTLMSEEANIGYESASNGSASNESNESYLAARATCVRGRPAVAPRQKGVSHGRRPGCRHGAVDAHGGSRLDVRTKRVIACRRGPSTGPLAIILAGSSASARFCYAAKRSRSTSTRQSRIPTEKPPRRAGNLWSCPSGSRSVTAPPSRFPCL